MIRLSNVFSDWMVLQRDTSENMIWGYADPDSYVNVTLSKGDPDDENTEIDFEGGVTIKDSSGYFEIVMGSFPAGGRNPRRRGAGAHLPLALQAVKRIGAKRRCAVKFACGERSGAFRFAKRIYRKIAAAGTVRRRFALDTARSLW